MLFFDNLSTIFIKELKFLTEYDRNVKRFLMKKFAFIMICVIIWSIFCGATGFYIASKNIKPVTITEKETVWKDKIVYRDYLSIPPEEILAKLKHYDNDEFFINIKPSSDTNKFKIEGRLYERSASKDFEVECGESGNWKLYGSIAAAGIIGTAIYIKTR